MKYTILGFDQEKSLEYKLDLTDLCMLRFFVDFVGSGDMKILIEDGKPYYWVSYDYLKENIPVINIASNDVLRRRFKKMVDAKVLRHKHSTKKGSFSYYGYGENYKMLIQNLPTQKSDPSDSKVGPPPTQKSDPSDSKVGTKILLLKDSSISNINIYSQVIDYLNEKLGSSYRASTKSNINLIKARVNEGFKLEDFKKVIDTKCLEWSNSNMEQYLRPQTLFGPKFESYLNQGGKGNGSTKQALNENKGKYEFKDFNKKEI